MTCSVVISQRLALVTPLLVSRVHEQISCDIREGSNAELSIMVCPYKAELINTTAEYLLC